MTIGDNTYTFTNVVYGNRNNWGHKSTLYKNGMQIGEAKIRYYNRTWEKYTYQSVMQSAVSNLMDNNLINHIAEYKETNNVKRLSKEVKDKVMAEFTGNAELQELYDSL